MQMAEETGQNRHFRIHQAPSKQDRLQRLRNAVSADLVRPITRHQSDDQTADDGHYYAPDSKMMTAQDDRIGGETQKKRGVGEHRNEPKQRLRHQGRNTADGQGERRQEQHPPIGGKVG